MAKARSVLSPAEAMNERGRNGLQEQVRMLAKTEGAGRPGGPRYYHTHDSRHSPKGFPDVMIVWPCGRHVVVECKKEHAKVEPDQVVWLDYYLATGAEVYVWRPRHFYTAAIQRLLRTRRWADEHPTHDWGLWPNQGGPR